MKHRSLSLFMTVAALGVAAPLLAQGRTAVTSVELDAAVASRAGSNRAPARQLLSTDQTRATGGVMQAGPSDLSARVAPRDQASIDLLADRTEVGDRILAGGADTIVISTTAVIIGLLLIIVLTQ